MYSCDKLSKIILVKKIIEVGPIEYDKRLLILNKLERKNLKIKELSKEEKACYTKIYTNTVNIDNWKDINLIFDNMNQLYLDESCQHITRSICEVIDEIIK